MSAPRTEQHGRVRIIGGQWKKRLIRFRGSSELRPTPDSVRETLFNWLEPTIEGSRCLDLFAGSGALGFEAASRGAAEVTLIESQHKTWRQLNEMRDVLKASQITTYLTDALDWLDQCGTQFDVVFVDPPYGSGLVDRALRRLARGRCLAPEALVYVEYRMDEKPTIPDRWDKLREKTAGQVRYSLFLTDRSEAS